MKHYAFFIMCIGFSNALAQVETKTTHPSELIKELELNQIDLPPPIVINDVPKGRINQLIEEDIENDNYGNPFRFAELIDTDISNEHYGTKNQTENFSTWTVGIKTKNAKSLSVTFENLVLTPSAEIFLFTPDRQLIYGPLKSENFKQGMEISTEVLPGNFIYLFYRIPLGLDDFSTLNISKIGYGYREGGANFQKENAVEYRLKSCHVDITSSDADCFQMERRAVGRTLINNSTTLCSGSLINNTSFSSNKKPYFITANHCSFSQSNGNPINFANIGFRFLDYTGSYSTLTFIGANERVATGNISDCSLLEMDNPPSTSKGLFYIGWSRNLSPSSSAVIHHPDGAKMKLSYDSDAPNSTTGPTTGDQTFVLPADHAWQIDIDNSTSDFGAFEGEVQVV